MRFSEKKFVNSEKCLTFASELLDRVAQMAESVDALVSNQWSNPCRFDPGSGYKEAAKCYYYNAWLLFLRPIPLSLVVL